MQDTHARSSHVPGLDLLRALAIVWVMLFHSFLVGGLGENFGWLSRFGWTGVDIFFVLSGYLIGVQVLAPLARGSALDFGRFYARRAWRILPAFAVTLAIYVAWPAAREAQGLAPWWRFATFTLNLASDYTHEPAFSHAWSLCVEEHFYLVFPLVAWWLTRRASTSVFAALCAAIVALGIALRTAVWLHDAALDPPRNWYIEDIYYPTWMRLDGLLAGVVLAGLRVWRADLWTRWQRHATRALLAGLALVAIALWLFRDRTGLLPNAIGWPLLSFGLGGVVFAAAGANAPLSRWRVPGAGWVAAISYSLYLSHKLAYHAVSVTLGPLLEGQRAATFAAYAAAVLLFGAGLHYTVERPFLALRERRERGAHSNRLRASAATESA